MRETFIHHISFHCNHLLIYYLPQIALSFVKTKAGSPFSEATRLSFKIRGFPSLSHGRFGFVIQRNRRSLLRDLKDPMEALFEKFESYRFSVHMLRYSLIAKVFTTSFFKFITFPLKNVFVKLFSFPNII